MCTSRLETNEYTDMQVQNEISDASYYFEIFMNRPCLKAC